MLHVTASLLLPLNPVMMVLSDGTVTGWIGVLRTSQVNEKGWVGKGGGKVEKKWGECFPPIYAICTCGAACQYA